MCDVKITFELIVALAALVVAIMSYWHAVSFSNENKRQMNDLDRKVIDIYDLHKNKYEKEEREKEEREKSFEETMEKTRKYMNDFMKKEEQRYHI